MKLSLTLLFFIFSFACPSLHAIQLTPPKGWECISDPAQLPQKILSIYVGAGKGQFTPSINIASEETTQSLDEYIRIAKSHHETQGETRCALLGSIDTKSGKAKLLQIDRVTNWGNVRFLQAILLEDKTAYVLTATCLQEEFSSLSGQFFKSFQSFSIK